MYALFSPLAAGKTPRANSVLTTQMKDRRTEPTATALITGRIRRRPKMPLIRKPSSGSSGISQRYMLVFHGTDFVDLQRFTVLEDSKNDGQADGGFRRGDHHDEEGKDLPIHLFEMPREGDKAQVHGVEHQLDGHEDGDDVAAEEEAGNAEAEENGAEDEIPVHRHAAAGGHLIELLPREYDGAENSDQDEDRGDFERQQILREEAVADVVRRAFCAAAAEHHRFILRQRGLDDKRDQAEEDHQ